MMPALLRVVRLIWIVKDFYNNVENDIFLNRRMILLKILFSGVIEHVEVERLFVELLG